MPSVSYSQTDSVSLSMDFVVLVFSRAASGCGRRSGTEICIFLGRMRYRFGCFRCETRTDSHYGRSSNRNTCARRAKHAEEWQLTGPPESQKTHSKIHYLLDYLVIISQPFRRSREEYTDAHGQGHATIEPLHFANPYHFSICTANARFGRWPLSSADRIVFHSRRPKLWFYFWSRKRPIHPPHTRDIHNNKIFSLFKHKVLSGSVASAANMRRSGGQTTVASERNVLCATSEGVTCVRRLHYIRATLAFCPPIARWSCFLHFYFFAMCFFLAAVAIHIFWKKFLSRCHAKS